jgi:acetolactate synthase-1/2/3 large subunit
VLVVNNGAYGTIRMHQERSFPGRVSFTEIVNPDFVAIARAYGFRAERVTRTAEFAEAFDRALAAPEGALLELVVPVEALAPRVTVSQLRAARG